MQKRKVVELNGETFGCSSYGAYLWLGFTKIYPDETTIKFMKIYPLNINTTRSKPQYAKETSS